MRLVLLGGAPGVGKTATGRELLRLAEGGSLLVQWVDVDSLWLHQPWEVSDRTTAMLQANLRAVLHSAQAAGVDVVILTWVFQDSALHQMVRDCAPTDSTSITVRLHASPSVWRTRFEHDADRPPIDEFYRTRYAQANNVDNDHTVDTDHLTPEEAARRVAGLVGLIPGINRRDVSDGDRGSP